MPHYDLFLQRVTSIGQSYEYNWPLVHFNEQANGLKQENVGPTLFPLVE